MAIRFLTEFFADQSSQDLPEIDVMGVWLWPRGQQKLMWAMKKRAPWLVGLYWGWHFLPMLYRDYNIIHYKDPYKPTKNFHGKFRAVFFFRGSLWGSVDDDGAEKGTVEPLELEKNPGFIEAASAHLIFSALMGWKNTKFDPWVTIKKYLSRKNRGWKKKSSETHV